MRHIKILFVCLGNICRSPMAEGVFNKIIKDRNLQHKFFVDSAGTSGYHIGELADPRMRKTANAYRIALTHKARKLIQEDLDNFDYIVAMDRSNKENIGKLILSPGSVHHQKVIMMRDFDPEPGDGQVPDPYFGGEQGFEEVYQMLLRSGEGLLGHLISKHQL
jgi:protein-tyrosine phosphatase